MVMPKSIPDSTKHFLVRLSTPKPPSSAKTAKSDYFSDILLTPKNLSVGRHMSSFGKLQFDFPVSKYDSGGGHAGHDQDYYTLGSSSPPSASTILLLTSLLVTCILLVRYFPSNHYHTYLQLTAIILVTLVYTLVPAIRALSIYETTSDHHSQYLKQSIRTLVTLLLLHSAASLLQLNYQPFTTHCQVKILSLGRSVTFTCLGIYLVLFFTQLTFFIFILNKSIVLARQLKADLDLYKVGHQRKEDGGH